MSTRTVLPRGPAFSFSFFFFLHFNFAFRFRSFLGVSMKRTGSYASFLFTLSFRVFRQLIFLIVACIAIPLSSHPLGGGDGSVQRTTSEAPSLRADLLELLPPELVVIILSFLPLPTILTVLVRPPLRTVIIRMMVKKIMRRRRRRRRKRKRRSLT